MTPTNDRVMRVLEDVKARMALRSERAKLAAEGWQLSREVEFLSDQVEVQLGEHAALAAQAAEIDAELAELRQAVGRLRDEHAALPQRRDAEALERGVRERYEALPAIESEIESLRAETAALQVEIADVQARSGQAEALVSEIEPQADKLAARRERLTVEAALLPVLCAAIDEWLSGIGEGRGVSGAPKTAVAFLRDLADRTAAEESALADMAQAYDALTREREKLAQRLTSLERQLAAASTTFSDQNLENLEQEVSAMLKRNAALRERLQAVQVQERRSAHETLDTEEAEFAAAQKELLEARFRIDDIEEASRELYAQNDPAAVISRMKAEVHALQNLRRVRSGVAGSMALAAQQVVRANEPIEKKLKRLRAVLTGVESLVFDGGEMPQA